MLRPPHRLPLVSIAAVVMALVPLSVTTSTMSAAATPGVATPGGPASASSTPPVLSSAAAAVVRDRDNAAPSDTKGARAAPLDRPVEVFVLRQELSAVLQTLAEQAGVRVNLGKGLSRTLSNVQLKGTTADALDTIAEQIGAVWWWSGTEVRMVDRSDLVTKTIKTRDFDATLTAAKSLGIPIDLLTAQKAEGPGIVRVTGPSGLVSEVESLVKDVAEQEGKIHVTRYGKRRSITTR